ncbi:MULTISPECIES: hypothetical protein [unclassified Polaribacter]|uniref:hypothetical protein n=1 Tax=unclassified Polaribacter TaxID=196858 RepID=UPI001C4E7F09|nr:MULTISPECIES: hypothetical protein [unclassified Polaribacter]QXP63331.1 hypothetical protein H0I27_16060 [Polaribacter sp. HaHaR_3_91]QXP65845.1 hypothetical protein H0I28_11660 [Polaribacter sp. AHE13PA]
MKKSILSIVAIASLVLSSCSLSDDDAAVIVGGEVTAQNLAGNLTSDLTLSSGVAHNLTGALLVKSGATLTIEAGTTVNALAGGTDVYILVEKGGKIIADGTAENPIKFTSSAIIPNAGDWGGIILNGNAPLSRQSGADSNAATEVKNSILFGGSDVDDNSGVLDYVIMEYTGARIDDEAEHNGLTLNGVGAGTSISNIAIFNGDDDGIEFFGGTVNVSNILVVNAKDDMFDFSQGYVGTCTNLYGVRENGYTAVTSDPRGIEADGNLDGNSPSDINESNFTINGVTIINNADGVEMSDGIKIRRDATATITNAYLALGAGALFGDVVDLQDSKSDSTESTTITGIANTANGLDITDVKNTTVGGASITLTAGTTGGADNSVFSWTGYNF